MCDWQIRGSVKDYSGEELPKDSLDNKQAETVIKAKGNAQIANNDCLNWVLF